MDGRDLHVKLNIISVKNGVVECMMQFGNYMTTTCEIKFPPGLAIDNVPVDTANHTTGKVNCAMPYVPKK